MSKEYPNPLEMTELSAGHYAWAANATMSDGFHIDVEPNTESGITPRGWGQLRELHGAMGIVTEVTELYEMRNKVMIDIINLSEEIGDVLWYLSIFNRAYGFFPEADGHVLKCHGIDGLDNMLNYLQVESGNLLDIYKKALYYGKVYEPEVVIEKCNNIFIATALLANYADLDIPKVRAVNITKLWTRFNVDYEKYSTNSQLSLFNSNDAINRDLDTERDVLAQGI